MKKLINWLPVFTLMLLLFSCVKEETPEKIEKTPEVEKIVYTSDAVKSAIDINSSFKFTDNILFQAFDFFTGKMKSESRDFSCADISFENDFWKTPNIMTIDFGDGCENGNGDIFAGKLIVDYNKFLNRTGAVRTTSFDQFSINGDLITGTETTSNLGRNSNEHYEIQKTLTDGIINTEENPISLAYNHIYTFAMSGSPMDFTDKNIVISGSSSGTTPEGEAFTATIDSPINISAECKCTNAGQETFVFSNGQFVVDFGDGSCEAITTITLPDNSVETTDICE